MSFLPRSFALYGDSPRLNRGNRTPGPGSDLTTRYPYVLFRDGGLFGLRTRRKVELDFPFLVQDEARAKRFAGTGPKAGDDLLRLPLLEELARVRRRGYATALGEFEMGLNAVAAPVHDARGNVIAAVDIWGPAFRLTPRRIPELAAQAREAAASISVRLGGTGTATAAQPTLAQALSHTAIGTESAVAPDVGLVTELTNGVAAAS